MFVDMTDMSVTNHEQRVFMEISFYVTY
jgi:hypothetical protein